MKFLTKLVAISLLLLTGVSAYASRCQLGGYGECLWAFDKKEPDNAYRIDGQRFLEFCAKNYIYCSTYNNGYNSIMGRYFDYDVFIIASKEWGGPDLILKNKADAERFANELKSVTNTPDALFYIKNDPHPMRNALAVCYKEITAEGKEEIKLFLLPNEWGETGDNYTYVPPDM